MPVMQSLRAPGQDGASRPQGLIGKGQPGATSHSSMARR